jgi:putative ABC transport system substrate-binding protein
MNFEAEMMGKWLQLLKEISPRIVRVALLFNPETAPAGGDFFLRSFEAVAPQFGVKPIATQVRDGASLDSAIAALAREPDCGLVVMSDVFTMTHHEAIGSLAARYRVPAVYPFRYFATAGGLISYGIDVIDLFKKAGLYVDRILKGAKPADLPVQAPTKFELVVNLKAARALGISIPSSLLARADEVIE